MTYDEQVKNDAAEVERRAAHDKREATMLPRPSHEVYEAARLEALRREVNPLPGEEGYVAIKPERAASTKKAEPARK